MTKAFVVVDALGEPYAIRYTPGAVLEAVRDATRYLDEAVASGHPAAPTWVAKRLPLRVVTVDNDFDLWTIVCDVVPVLDREP